MQVRKKVSKELFILFDDFCSYRNELFSAFKVDKRILNPFLTLASLDFDLIIFSFYLYLFCILNSIRLFVLNRKNNIVTHVKR